MKKEYYIFIPIIVFLILLNSLFFIVNQQNKAIVFQFGEAVRTVNDPGLHVKIPFIQDVKYFDNRILNFNLREQEIQAQDKKRIIVSAFLKYRIIDAIKYYQALGNSDASSRLNSILDSSLRQVIGQNSLNNLLSRERVSIMNKIENIVSEKTIRYGIQIVDLRILRADLPKENSEAIYKRMQSDREMEAREYRAQGQEEAERITSEADREVKVLLAKAYKEAQILKGDGDKTSSKIYSQSYSQDPDFYSFYKSMDVYKQSFNKDSVKIVITPDNGFMKYFFND